MSAKQDFENMLRYSAKPASVNPEELVSMGKRASRMFLDHNVPLTEAIIKIASEQPGLTRDHVQRIIENANLLTFENLFKSAADKNVSFELGDPDDVMTGLNPNSSPEVTDLSAYAQPPVVPDIPGALASVVKTASYTDVPVDLMLSKLYSQTKHGGEYLESELNAIDSHAEVAMSKLASFATQAVREGSSITEVLELMAEASSDAKVFEKISSVIGRDLKRISNNIGDPLDGVPNVEHPIFSQYKLAEALIKKAEQINAAASSLSHEKQRIRDAQIRLHNAK